MKKIKVSTIRDKHFIDESLKKSIKLLTYRFGCVLLSVPLVAEADSSESMKVNNNTLEEVVVTARKREESVQDVPVSVTAFGEKQLERVGVNTINDLKNVIPSYHQSTRANNNNQVTLRGVGGDSRNIGIESGVGFYIDGVYAGRTNAYNADLADIESIQVLRGPQGTLFGRNTIGGAVLINSKKPTDEPSGSIKINYGKYHSLRIVGSFSGPLSDTVSAKLTASKWDRDGTVTNVFDGSKTNEIDRIGLRAQLRWVPNDDWEINTSVDQSEDEGSVLFNQIGDDQGANAAAFSGPLLSDNELRFFANSNGINETDRTLRGGHVQVDHNLPSGAVLTSITSYREIRNNPFSDADGTPTTIVDVGDFTDDSNIFAEELRYVSPSEAQFRYAAGLYYYYQSSEAIRDIYIAGTLVPGSGVIQRTEVETKAYAAFANADYDFTDDVTFNVGVRITREEKEAEHLQQRPAATNGTYFFPELTFDDTAVSWTTGFTYAMNESMSGYLTVSKGFKSGGFNVDSTNNEPAPLTEEDFVFDSESLTNYELGLKGDLLKGRMRFSAAAFFAEYDNRQVNQFIDRPGQPLPAFRITNAGTAEIKGVEFETTALLTDNFTGWLSLSVLDGEYTNFEDAGGLGVSFTGNTLERTPDYSFNLGLGYEHPLNNGSFVALTGDVAIKGDTELQPDNEAQFHEDGYKVFNFRLGWTSPSERYKVSVYGKNIGDEVYREFARQFLGGLQVLWGDSRMYGIEFLANY